MGIPGLWKLLGSTVQSRTLTQLSVNEGFESNRRGTGKVYLGLDASLLLNRAQWAAYHQKGRGINMQAGENLPLQILFWQVCRLLSLPITTVFIFDGPDRPKLKREHEVKTAPHALMLPFLQLIKDAGFNGYVAPGEAEAELSQLNARGEIDAVITDDVDAFLFGATHIIRVSNVINDGDYISIFTSTAINDHQTVQLTPARILLIAVLRGGDYAPGLQGCGISIAHRLSTGTSLGEDLYAAACDLSHSELSGFLRGWRAKLVQQLLDDPDKILGRRYPAVAKNVSSKFPSRDVLRHYVHPVTSWSEGSIGSTASCQEIRPPDLAALAVWCEKYFSWGTSGCILDRFRTNLWNGICIRSLMKPIDMTAAIAAHVSQNTSEMPASFPMILKVYRASLGPGTPSKKPNTWGYNVQVEPHALVLTTLSKLLPAIREVGESQPRKTVAFWIPAPILQRALPNLVQHFHASRARFTQPRHASILSVIAHDSSVLVDMTTLGSSSSSHTSDISGVVEGIHGVGSGTVWDPIVLDDVRDDTTDTDRHEVGPRTRLESLLAGLDAIL